MLKEKEQTETHKPKQLVEVYGESALLAVCSAIASFIVWNWSLSYLGSAYGFLSSPLVFAIILTLSWVCFLFIFVRLNATWLLAVSTRWAAMAFSCFAIPLLYKPFSFARSSLLYLQFLSAIAFVVLVVRFLSRKSKTPAEENLRKATSRVLDFGVVPLLLATLLIDPVYFIYLRWPEAEKFFCYEGYRFFGEIGQFLAWANAVYHGAWQGRDFFCLYGPLYIFSIAGMWELAGKSVQALGAYWQLMGALSLIAVYAFFRQYWRWRVLCALAALALVFTSVLEYPLSSCRFTAALAAFALLSAHGRGVRGLLAPAGFLAAIAIATSQEVGMAFLAGALVFLVCDNLRNGSIALSKKVGMFALGFLAVVVPLAIVFAAHGAFWPMVRNVIEYPRAVALGYGNYLFPRADSVIPLNLTGAPLSALFIRAGIPSTILFYYAPAVYAACVAYLAIRLTINRLRFDTFDSMIAGLVAAGVILFGVALGRSDYAHLIFALPPALLLHLLFVGRIAEIIKENVTERKSRGWRRSEVLVSAIFLLVSMWFFNPALFAHKAISYARASVQKMAFVLNLPTPPGPIKGPSYMGIVDYVKSRTNPQDYVLALPNDSAYYYLTDRPNPTRFCQFSMLATNAQRNEVLNDIQKRRPKYVIYDIVGERVDDLSDEVQFPGAFEFILQNYAAEKRVGDTLILLDGARIPNWRPSETTLLDWDLSQSATGEQLKRTGARLIKRDDSGLYVSLEAQKAGLEIQDVDIDSRAVYQLSLTANIAKGNVGRVEWTVKGVKGRRVYSKMFAVDMNGDWRTYNILIITPDPAGQIESIRLIPSDGRSEATIRTIKLTRLNHLSPQRFNE